MFKIITLSLFVASSLMASSASAFFEGCYKTLEVNGKTILPGPRQEMDLSRIYNVEENEFYYDLETRDSLSTTVFSVFTGYDGRFSSFKNPLVFTELGKLETTKHSFSYDFEGEVFHRNRYYGMDKVDFATKVRLQKHVGIVTGHIEQSSQALDRHNKIQIILKQTPCGDR